MIVEAFSERPRFLTEEVRTKMREAIKESIVTFDRGSGRYFDEKGCFDIGISGFTLGRLWSSNVMGWDPENYSLRCGRDGFLNVYEGNGFSTSIVQVIDPGNLRYIDRWRTDIVVVGEKGFVRPPLSGISECDLMVPLEAFLEESKKGIDSDFHGKPHPMMRVCDPQLIGQEVHWIQFHRFSNSPFMVDGVLVDQKGGKLVKKAIPYPFLTDKSYQSLREGTVPVDYTEVDARDYFEDALSASL